MLIDISYFTKGERQLMNANNKPITSNEVAVKTFVEGYIESLEENFLTCMVGKDILRDMNETTTITGVVRLKNANTYVSPIHRQVSVWNTMVDRNRAFVEWASSDECPFKIRISKNMLSYINSMNL